MPRPSAAPDRDHFEPDNEVESVTVQASSVSVAVVFKRGDHPAANYALLLVMALLPSGCFSTGPVPDGKSSEGQPVPPGELLGTVSILRDGETELSTSNGRVSLVRADLYGSVVATLATPGNVLIPSVRTGDVRDDFPRNPGFTGPDKCRECHAEYVASCERTPHFRTALLATGKSLSMALENSTDLADTAAAGVSFRVDEAEGQWFQTAIVTDRSGRQTCSSPFSLITGSGRHGQTYLSWHQNALFQLPLSYVTPYGGLRMSPGYQTGVANFARPVSARCLECHTTWFAHRTGTVNEYQTTGFLTGVTCEKCHGPGQEHVEWHTTHPADSEPHAIMQASKLTREQSIELCSLCHSGVGKSRRPPFSWRPGQPLSEFLTLDHKSGARGPGGVHAANQAARLSLSRCFQNSAMTCVSCHDVHSYEPVETTALARHCLQCHDIAECKPAMTPDRRELCVACHMPVREDRDTVIATDSGGFSPLLRDHFIAIWPDMTDKVP